MVLNARDAHARGAEVRTRTACVSLAPHELGWQAVLADRVSGERFTVTTRSVVNASGPWVGRIRSLAGGAGAKHRVRLIKGSHIVVRKLFDHAHPYIFQSGDGRVLFAIPFEEDYTLLGTTDVEIRGRARAGRRSRPRKSTTSAPPQTTISGTLFPPSDVVWTYSGIRPLLDDQAENASEVTRDYVLHLDSAPAPMLSVYGGKITTYRRLAEQAVDMLAGPLRVNGSRWTCDAPLPGGDIPNADIGEFTAQCAGALFMDAGAASPSLHTALWHRDSRLAGRLQERR